MGELLSPIELWNDFSVKLDDPEINVINQTVADGYICREFYFTAYQAQNGKVRAYARFYYDPLAIEQFGGKAPVVFFLGSSKRFEQTLKFLTTNLKGVSIFTIDYFGQNPQNSRYTIYPEVLSYANFSIAQNDLSLVKSSPKESPWYIWTAMARRALTLLETLQEVDSTKIAIMGIKTGANLAWKIAATDNRACCFVSMFNSGWLGYDFLYKKNRESDVEISEERSIYLASLSTQSYAPLVKTPILVTLSTNECDSTFDRAFDTYSRIPQDTISLLSVIPYSDKEIFFEYSNTIINWLNNYLLQKKQVLPEQPKLRFYNSDNRLYIEIKADTALPIKEIRLYQATETPDPCIRNWTRLKCDTAGDGIYFAAAEILDVSEYYFAFANVFYQNDYVSSSNMSAIIPSELKVMTPNVKASRLVYDSSLNLDCFTVINSEELFHNSKELVMEKGAFDMYGIKALIGDLATFKLGDPKFKGYEGDQLQIGYYSPVNQKVIIALKNYINEKWEYDYYYTLNVEGAEIWNKVTLAANEFKTSDGISLKSFENIALLYIKCQDKFLINNIIWV
ncbi:MAG TPA: hypothetical protein VIL26_08440 [Clostridia bacterium]